MKFSNSIIKALKFYVYIYVHPISNEIFYVGKGKGNRIFSHLDDKKESEKVAIINDLKQKGLTPKIEILIHGLEDEKTALRVESSIIDLLGLHNLSNKQTGYKSAKFGRMTLEQVKSAYDQETVDINEPAILIRISQAFRYSMSDVELYDYTRGQWRLNPERASRAKYAFAVYGGIVQEVYTVLHWYEANQTFNVRKSNENINRKEDRTEGRYEFIGNIAEEKIRKKYRHKSVEHYFKLGNSNPIRYVNLD